jgi:hypothetical protein
MDEAPATQVTTAPDLPHHEGLEARIADAILPSLGQLGYELVRVQVSGKERPVVQVMADRADGTAFRVEDCEGDQLCDRRRARRRRPDPRRVDA